MNVQYKILIFYWTTCTSMINDNLIFMSKLILTRTFIWPRICGFARLINLFGQIWTVIMSTDFCRNKCISCDLCNSVGAMAYFVIKCSWILRICDGSIIINFVIIIVVKKAHKLFNCESWTKASTQYNGISSSW